MKLQLWKMQEIAQANSMKVTDLLFNTSQFELGLLSFIRDIHVEVSNKLSEEASKKAKGK